MAPTDLLYLRILTALFAVVSAILVPSAIRQRQKELHLGAGGRVAEATVVKATLVALTGTRDARVRFTVDGTERTADVATRTTLHEGDRVRIRYRSEDPGQAVLTAPAEAVPRGAWVLGAWYAAGALALFLILGTALVIVTLRSH